MDIYFVRDLPVDSFPRIEDRTSFYRGFFCLLNAVVWYFETNSVGIGIAGVEAVLYTTCIFLSTIDETVATAMLTRHFISLMLVFDCQSSILAISTAAYFNYTSGHFERFVETIVMKSAVVNVLSYFVSISKYLYMYMTSLGVICLYSSLRVKGMEDISLFAAVSIPLLQSCLEDVTKDTLLSVLSLLLFWGERKLNVLDL